MGLRFTRWVLALVVFAAATTAYAWNEPGHELVGLLASKQLAPVTYDRVIATLRLHPVFERHFLGAMPATVWQANDAEKARWLFCHTGQWPDMVRSAGNLVTQQESGRFSRPEWHFLDLPIVLAPSEEVAASIARLNTSRDLPQEIDESQLNGVQAVEFGLRTLRDPDAKDPDRAVALCWLSHLVADLHQPCHAASLYAAKTFPDGDRGASSLQTARSKNLHALWDSALLDRVDFGIVRAKARRMAPLVAAVTEEAASAPPGAWLEESNALAKSHVYTPAVRSQIEAWEQEGKQGELELDPHYLKAMRQTSQSQAALAARRLAHLIESAFPPAHETAADPPHRPALSR